MLSAPVTVLVVLAALGAAAVVGLRTRSTGLADFALARSSQRPGALAWSFLASGIGAWALLAPPEVGATVGLVGVVGYALAAGAPILLFALLGPVLRRAAPEAHGITEFVRVRYGAVAHRVVAALAVAYLLTFLSAELTAVGGITSALTDVDPRVTVAAVAVATLAYTAVGGLRASMRTDRVQGWLLLALLGAGAAAAVALVGVDPSGAGPRLAADGLLAVDRVGIEAAVTLVLAVAAGNLFHQGYWQRVHAARDARALRRGGLVAAAASVPVVGVLGLAGLHAVGAGLEVGSPPVPFFALLAALPTWAVAVGVGLAVTLVASSADTVENALGSLAVSERPSIGLVGARLATVVLVLPAVVVGWQQLSVLRLFLVADLLCAAALGPVPLGLWRRPGQAAAVAGVAAGLGGAVLPGWATAGSLAGGLRLATFPDAVPTLWPFAGAIVLGALVTVVVAAAVPDRHDRLATMDERVRPLGG